MKNRLYITVKYYLFILLMPPQSTFFVLSCTSEFIFRLVG